MQGGHIMPGVDNPAQVKHEEGQARPCLPVLKCAKIRCSAEPPAFAAAWKFGKSRFDVRGHRNPNKEDWSSVLHKGMLS
jgi:hypothetical protein